MGGQSKLIEEGWALQPSLVNNNINLGTTNAQKSAEQRCHQPHALPDLPENVGGVLISSTHLRCNQPLFTFSGEPTLFN